MLLLHKGWTDGRTDGRTDGGPARRMDGPTDGLPKELKERTDRWMDGRTEMQRISIIGPYVSPKQQVYASELL